MLATVNTAAGTAAWEQDVDGLDVRLAGETEVFDAAFRLVHDRYVDRGYMCPSRSGRRLSIFHALPTTKVFVVRRYGAVIGTVSVVQDSRLGLPMDEVYGNELHPWRAGGQHLAEVSALTVIGGERATELTEYMRLVRVALIYAAKVARVDRLCVTVNPRHGAFYRRFAFEPLGPSRSYGKVNGAPAIALSLDLEAFRAETVSFPARVARFLYCSRAQRAIIAELERELPWSVMTPSQFDYFFADGEAFAGVDSAAVRAVSAVYARAFPSPTAGAVEPVAAFGTLSQA